MSLNGLDDPKITEAYQSVIADAGGWFLLKYASRDAMEILKRGSGGAYEARDAIAEYGDLSPLYGFLIYRRRKVLLKYIPDGISRLVQARVTVHFQSFEDKFKPHDTVIIIATANELTDAALSAACSLHSAADTSTRSSGGSAQVRKSKLDEILEDPKERPSYDARAASIDKESPPLPSIPTITETAPIDLRTKELPNLPDEHSDRPATRDSYLSQPPPVASRKAAAILGIPLAAVSSASLDQSPQRPTTPNPPGDTASLYAASISSATRNDFRSDYLAYLDALDTRSSTSTARPSLSDLYAELYKPKVKLGPRPSADGALKAAAGPRPISSLPPGLRAAPRKDLHSANRGVASPPAVPKDAVLAEPIVRLPPPPPIPESPAVVLTEVIRPSSKAASVKSMPVTLASKEGRMTPEKKRLKKAMEMRKRQMAEAAKRGSIGAFVPVVREGVGKGGRVEGSSKAEELSRSERPLVEINVEPAKDDVAESSNSSEPSADVEATGQEQAEEAVKQTAKESEESEDPLKKTSELTPALETEELREPTDEKAEVQSDKVLPLADDSLPEIKLPERTQEEVVPPTENRLPEIQLPGPMNEQMEPKQEEVKPLTEDTLPEIKLPEPTERDTVRNPTRASGDHLKADSGVQIEVTKPESEADESWPVRASSLSPESAKPTSESPSAPESSLSETEEEHTIASAQAEKEEYTQSRDETLSTPQQEEPESKIEVPTVSIAPPKVAESASPTTQEATTQEVSPTSVKERAVELQLASEAEAVAEDKSKDDDEPTPRGTPKLQPSSEPAASPTTPASSKQERRRGGLLTPLNVVPITPGAEESEFDLSDDDLMSELQSAEVQEAKPMQVTKGHSPVTARFPRPLGADSPKPSASPSSTDRRPSQPLPRSDSDRSIANISRSASAGQLSKMPGAEGTITVAKSVNVSSGISQRIKALARNSGTVDAVTPDRMNSRDSSGQSIVALRKSSLGDGLSRPSSAAAHSAHVTTRERVSSLSRNASPAVDLSNRNSQVSTTAVYSVSQRTGRPDSISVTARIVRDDRTQKPSLAAPTQATPLELHESPLVIGQQHKRTSSVPVVPRILTRKTESSSDTFEPSSPASPAGNRSLKSPITPVQGSSSDSWRNSFSLSRSRRASDAKSPTPFGRSPSSTSLGTIASRDSENTTDKKSSRSSRMLKRMSNSISLGRKTITQIVGPTFEEPSSVLPERVSEERRPDPHSAVEIGDLNVQLPDTLLWKRRWVEIDGEGNIVVKMSKSNEMANTRNNTKSFHASELKRPFLPDQERQEMPFSVVLDFVDGRTMQCACESVGGQMEVLRLLQEAHEAHSRS